VCIARVLLADAHAEHRGMLEHLLSRAGYRTRAVADGRQALELLGRESFDLILVEWTPPGTDSLQLLERVRDHADWKEIPVVVLAALAELEEVTRCLELGAEDFLLKPFNLAMLGSRLNSCLERKRLRGMEEEMHRVLAQAGGRDGPT
jgi:DNA-binding response OmpR family regulator